MSTPTSSASVQSATTGTVSIPMPISSTSVQCAATGSVYTSTTNASVQSATIGAVSTPTPSVSVQSTVTGTVSITTSSVQANLTQEETNYLRLTALILKIAPRALRQLFDMYISPNNLNQKLNDQSNRDKLQKLKERRVLNKEQWNTLYPPSGRVNSTNFDITLMTVLLKEICGIAAPSTGWNRLPNIHDYSEGAEIARVSVYRNQIIHGSKFSINNHDFNSRWSDLKQILVRVGGQGYTAEIDALMVCSLDQSYNELYKELKQLKIEPRIPDSMQAYRQAKIEGWMDEDRAYVHTRATQSTTEMSMCSDIVTLTGPPGCGKSATAHHMAIQLQNNDHTIYPVKTIKDIVEFWTPGLKQVFVLDDPFGVHDANTNAINDWEMYKDVIDCCHKYGCLKILMTIRQHIIQDKQMKEVMQQVNKTIVNLGDESTMLLPEERREIFQRYATLYDRPDLLQIDSQQIQGLTISCFPLLCRLYAADKDSSHSVKTFFKRPMTIIDEEITKFQNKDPVRYFCLLLCMIYDNNLGLSTLKFDDKCKENKTIRKDFLELCGLPRSLSRVKIESKMDTLLNTFLVKEGNAFHFIHDIIHDSVVKHVSSLSSEVHKIILKHCSRTFLRERIRLISLKSKDADTCINLKKNLEPVWGDRLLRDIRDGYWLDVFRNVCLTSEYGDNILAEELNKHETTTIQAFMCSVKITLDGLPKSVFYQIKDQLNRIGCTERKYFLKTPCTAFHFAVTVGLVHLVTKTLKTIPKTKTEELNNAIDSLSLACFLDKKDIVKVLIENETDLNYSHEYLGTPLCIALRAGRIEIAYTLIKSGADVNKCSQYRNPPLYIALLNKYDEIVKLLLENKADINTINYYYDVNYLYIRHHTMDVT